MNTLHTIQTAADELKVHYNNVWYYVRTEQVEYLKMGKLRVITDKGFKRLKELIGRKGEK